MTVIEGIQICIPPVGQKATAVLRGMVALLARRRHREVSRAVFLVRWGRLRKALFLTNDYQELRQRVAERSRGICEMCNKEPMAHVHHVVAVAHEPMMALREDNCQAACRKCHATTHDTPDARHHTNGEPLPADSEPTTHTSAQCAQPIE